MALWYPRDPGEKQRRIQVAIRWLQVLLYLLFLSYIALSLYFFYNGLFGLSVLPTSGIIAQQFPQVYRVSRISALIAIAFAMVMLITGVLGKIAVRTSSSGLLGVVAALQCSISFAMIGASVYAHNLAQFNDTTVPQVTENEQNVLTEFLDSTLITSNALGTVTTTGMLISLVMLVLLKKQQRVRRKRRSTSDTLELFESTDHM